MRIGFYSAAGGQGTSVVAAATALAVSQSGLDVALVDTAGDQRAIFGLNNENQVNDHLTIHDDFAPGDTDVTVFDLWHCPTVIGGLDATYLVTKPCYLALRRVADDPYRPTGIVVVSEKGRALDVHDVESLVNRPVIAEIPVDPAVARAVDAGTFASRRPRVLDASLKDLVRQVTPQMSVA